MSVGNWKTHLIVNCNQCGKPMGYHSDVNPCCNACKREVGLMTVTQQTVRFFTVAYIDDSDSEFSGDHIDTIEITEGCFTDLMRQSGGTAPVQYDRHTVFDHGAAQVCLTLDLDQWPHVDELEVVR